MLISELVAFIKAHARTHYEDGGWDVLVECWSDEELAHHLMEADAKTEAQAIASFADLVEVWAERQAEADSYRREVVEYERRDLDTPNDHGAGSYYEYEDNDR